MDAALVQIGLLDDEAIALDTAALELAALDHPAVSLDGYLGVLDDMTERLATTAGYASASAERARALAAIVGQEFGFLGDTDTYDDPANADLIRVLDRRRGLPVSLAILYVAQARRLGWSADALNTPGHVLVRVGPETDPVLIDPFAGGEPVHPDRLADLMARVLGPAAAPSPEHLAPMDNRGVLTRLLMNQASRAEATGELARALELYRRITTLAPAAAHVWWARARLELADARPADARASLSAMLEVTRDPGLRAHVFAALDTLSGSA
jgi:regulator of sirC expression with transglutaminase-like and TPR domain